MYLYNTSKNQGGQTIVHLKTIVIITLHTYNVLFHETLFKSFSCIFPSHSLAGVSRSITILMAYLMSVTTLNWKEALKCVRVVRTIANPNLGFQRQLQEFEGRRLREVKHILIFQSLLFHYYK